MVSRDRITFESATAGTRVTYDADLALKGLLRIADPALALAFNRIGNPARYWRTPPRALRVLETPAPTDHLRPAGRCA
ncbi:MAG TPA: hypothetical protein VFH80_06495 [Solirubrobacteraceae bacterium]|nr:hypothetical protein [Solirubrobacteraceae bacterium]